MGPPLKAPPPQGTPPSWGVSTTNRPRLPIGGALGFGPIPPPGIDPPRMRVTHGAGQGSSTQDHLPGLHRLPDHGTPPPPPTPRPPSGPTHHAQAPDVDFRQCRELCMGGRRGVCMGNSRFIKPAVRQTGRDKLLSARRFAPRIDRKRSPAGMWSLEIGLRRRGPAAGSGLNLCVWHGRYRLSTLWSTQ